MRATAVIIKNNSILLIHRFKNKHEYYVLPGGGVEDNETVEGAVIREVKEETNLDVKIDKKLWKYKDYFDNRNHYFFLITNFLGNVKLSGPEAKRNSKDDRYILEWHRVDELKGLLLYPETIKGKIIEEFS